MAANKINFSEINAVALSRLESLVREWLPGGKLSGAEYTALNPTRNDGHAGSFSINIHKGVWQDFATGDKGGDPVSLYAYLFHNNDQGAAAKVLADQFGLAESTKPAPASKKNRNASLNDKKLAELLGPAPKKNKSAWQAIEPPELTADPPKAHPIRGRPEQIWHYLSATGKPLGYIFKFTNSKGGKEFTPLSWAKNSKTGAEGWRFMAFPEPRWLYGLDRLAKYPEKTVLLVEGEKCADAGAEHLPDLVCMTWPGGSKAVEKTNWQPLAGRKVIIWPDCDAQTDKNEKLLPADKQPGQSAANKIADKLQALGCHVWMLAIPQPGEKPSGWDIADVVAEGMTDQALKDYVRKNSHVQAPAKAPVANIYLKAICSVEELLERFSLIYAYGGTVFDHQERVMLTLTDLRDACISRDYVKHWQGDFRRKIFHIDNVGFDPAENDPKIHCNLWGGWPTQPKKGNCDKILKLLRYMCSNEDDSEFEELYNWILKWLAYPIQNPGAKMKSALVVHGPQGTGKNLVFECVMEIYDKYGRIIGQDAIEDRFNDWASKKLFLIADEVVARSDLYHVKNKLKSFITGDVIRINSKNIMAYDERNHVNLVFLSNERMPVVLEEDDRRHAVIWTPIKLDNNFYKQVAAEKANGGVAALHDYLLHVDLSGFSEHSIPPMTLAKQDLIALSQDTISSFYNEWVNGYIDGFECMPVLSDNFYNLYRVWCGKQGVKPAASNKFVDHIIKRKNAKKGRYRYLTGMIDNNPKIFLFPPGHEQVMTLDNRNHVLGRYVAEFEKAFDNFRGRQFV
jgi:hypothetical protein